ncbi:MAG: helix-turn-helix domain-containing protein [Candidatus Paceibacterota bacterium]
MSVSRGKYKQDSYEQAIAFRKRGFTYSEIAKICDVSVGTVSAWLKPLPFSEVITKQNKAKAASDNKKRMASINKARTTERAKQYAEVVRLAEIEYQNYRTSPLFMAGLMLYVSEGGVDKAGLIRLTSARPELHKIFVNFLISYLGVEKRTIRFWLLLYPDLNEVTCMKHWSKKTSISVSQFYKNQVIRGLSKKSTLHFGVGNTIIASTL